jgi:hypothetical protein
MEVDKEMSSENEDELPDLDMGSAIQAALADAAEEGEDPEALNVVSTSGMPEGEAPDHSDELPYVVLLKAAVSMVQTDELSMEEYIEGVMKLDAVADNALKVYEIPAVKKDLPGKLTEHQSSLMGGLEEQIHRMKDGLGMLLDYPETLAIGDLQEGLKMAVSAMNTMAEIQKAADAEQIAIKQREKDDRARRAQQAAEKAAQADS